MQHIKDEIEQEYHRANDQIYHDSIGKVYLKVPHDRPELPEDERSLYQLKGEGFRLWQPFHAKFENYSQLQFLSDINRVNFVINYIVFRATTHLATLEVFDPNSQVWRSIQVIEIKHRYDSKVMYLTIPQIYEPEHDLHLDLPAHLKMELQELRDRLNG